MEIDIEYEKGWCNAGFLFAPQMLSDITYYDLPYILRYNITPGFAMEIDNRARTGFLNTYDRKLPHDGHMNMIASVDDGVAYLDQDLFDMSECKKMISKTRRKRHGKNKASKNCTN